MLERLLAVMGVLKLATLFVLIKFVLINDTSYLAIYPAVLPLVVSSWQVKRNRGR